MSRQLPRTTRPLTRAVLAGAATAAVTGAALLLAPTAADAAGPAALWHFDDGGSTATDSSGHGHTGTLKNVTTGQPGAIGTSFKFATKPSYVSVPTAADLNPDTSAFSVSLRINFTVKPTPAVHDYDLIRKGLSTTSGGSWKVEITQSGKALCNYRDPAKTVEIIKGPDLSNGAWHTITCSRTSTKVTLTVDGTAYSKTSSTGKIANTSTLLIGAKNTSGDDQTTGRLDEVVITKG